MRTMVLEYLPTKLCHFRGKCFFKYSIHGASGMGWSSTNHFEIRPCWGIYPCTFTIIPVRSGREVTIMYHQVAERETLGKEKSYG